MISDKFVILAAVISFLGGLSYLIKTLQGKVRPNRVSFLMWALAPMIAFAAMISKGVGLAALLTFMAGFNPFCILVASFISKKAVWKLTAFDYWCGILSVLGLLLWLIVKEGNVAILFSILADGAAAIPTIAKGLKDPESESAGLFFLSAIAAGITLLTLKHWSFADYGFTLYILLICIVISSTVFFKIGKKIGY